MNPIFPDRAGLVDHGAVAAYFDMLFGYADEVDAIHLRGLGEKGTDGADFRERARVPHQDPGADAREAIEHARRWATHQRGSFVIPAVIEGDGERDENVKAFTTILVDIDSGDTDAKLAYIERALGVATMVVLSGGVTADGQFKRHVYWRLTEPADDVRRVAALRLMLARKVGGDPSFQRLPQIIRIPGTVHAKNGKPTRVTIERHRPDLEYDLHELEEAITDMRRMPGLEDPGVTQARNFRDFSQPGYGYEDSRTPIARVMAEPVGEGGTERTRWGEFSRAAGALIRQARDGMMDLETARGLADAWMHRNMMPPWPDKRFESEWRGLVQADERNHGAMPTPETKAAAGVTPQNGDTVFPDVAGETNVLLRYATHRWVPAGEIPKRRWLVEGLIAYGEPHLLVAEGGSGKTMAALDLGLALTAPEEHRTWWGQRITDECDGGRVVIVTTEDSARELRIRLAEIDPTGRRLRAADRLIVMPTASMQDGTLTLCERDQRGNVVTSATWRQRIAQIRALGDVRLVIVDTLNAVLHGDENSAVTMGEFKRAAMELGNDETGIAMMFTHHIRKSNEPIRDKDMMLQAVRGSNALPNAFRVVIGLWHAHDYEKRAPHLRLEPRAGDLWRAAIVKANNREVMRGTATLRRNPVGLLVRIPDDFDQHKAAEAKRAADPDTATAQRAWMLAAIARAAEADRPYRASGAESMATRRNELPDALRDLSREKLDGILHALKVDEQIVAPPRGKVDVPNGPWARGARDSEAAEAHTPSWEGWRYNNLMQAVVGPDRG